MSGQASREAITGGPGSPGDGNITVRSRTVSLESCDLAPCCPLGLQCTQLRGPLAGENTGFLHPQTLRKLARPETARRCWASTCSLHWTAAARCGRKRKFPSTLRGSLSGPEKSTDKDRLTGAKHTDLSSVSFTRHRSFTS